MQFVAVDKIGCHKNRKRKAALLLREIGNVQIFMKAATDVARYAQLDRLLRDLFHFAAATVSFSWLAIRRQHGVVPEKRMFAHFGYRDRLRCFIIDQILVA